MNYKKEEISKTLVKFTYEVSAEDWQKALNESYNKNKAKYAIDGFRKGKAPRKKIEALYGPGVFFDDAIDIAINEYYGKTFEVEPDLMPVARPIIDIVAVSDTEFSFSAEVTLKPEVELGEYKNLEIKKASVTVAKKELDEAIERDRERAGSWETVEGRVAENGDKTIIDYSGRVGDNVFEGGTAENQELVLGSGMFIPGFEEGVCGMAIGDTKEISVKFPEEYGAEDLAGADAVFTVTLHEIQIKKLPELDDEFAKDVSEFDTFKEYKADLKAKMTESKEKQADMENENNLVKKIVDSSKVDIPEIMIEERAEEMLREFEYRLMYQGLDPQNYYSYTGSNREDLKKEYLNNAKDSVKTQLVLMEIVEAEKLVDKDNEEDGAKLTEKLLEFLKSNNKFV